MVDVVVEADAVIGECPIWSPREQLLYWIDIEGRAIHRFDPVRDTSEMVKVDDRPGSLALTGTAGQLLIAMEMDIVWFDWTTEAVTPWIQLDPPAENLRLNDGRTDPSGRFWVGSMDEQFEEGRTSGELYRVDRDGTITSERSNIGIANGLAFDPDRNRMYFSDTTCSMVWQYDYDEATGRASNETPFVDFSDHRGFPDGACVDIDGGYWVAAAFGWAVNRFTPDGVLDRTIELPVQTPTMPAFGGERLDTLYVTTMGPESATAPNQHHPGSLFAIDPDTTGRTDRPFLAR